MSNEFPTPERSRQWSDQSGGGTSQVNPNPIKTLPTHLTRLPSATPASRRPQVTAAGATGQLGHSQVGVTSCVGVIGVRGADPAQELKKEYWGKIVKEYILYTYLWIDAKL